MTSHVSKVMLVHIYTCIHVAHVMHKYIINFCTCSMTMLVHKILLVSLLQLHTLLHHRTCFYALCLISKTIQGANVLLELGWTSVQHSPEEKWPLNFDQCLDSHVDESAFASPSSDSPTRKFTFAPFIGTSFDLHSPGTGSVSIASYSPSSSERSRYETLPGKVAGSKSFAENLHSSSPTPISPLIKDPKQSPHLRSSLRLTRRGLDKSDSSNSLLNMSASRVRRSISRKGSANKFFKSVKERSERSHRQHGLATKHSQSVSQGPSVRQRFSVSSMVSSPEMKTQRYVYVV